MRARFVAPIVFVLVVLLAAAVVVAPATTALMPPGSSSGALDPVFGRRQGCVCTRWAPLIASMEPGRIRALDVKI